MSAPAAPHTRMNKIPVGKTVAFAYSFVFKNVGTVIGITALPAVLASAIDYLVRAYISTEDTTTTAGMNLLISSAGMVSTILVWAVAAVGIVRAALGLPLGANAYYFPIGMPEIRMTGAMLRFWIGVIVLIVLASIVSSIAFGLAGVPLNGSAPPEPSAAILVAGIIAWSAFAYAIYTIFRIGFLLPATVVSEAKGGLQRSHDRARGNFWRIVAIVIVLMAPVFFLLSVAGAVILQTSLGDDYRRVMQEEGMNELIRRAEEAIVQNPLLWEICNALIFILASSLLFSASAYAYRVLTADAPTAQRSTLRPPEAGN